MFLIVGLGNPGAKYAHSRHNVGFDVVEVLSQRHDIPLKRSKCKATIGEGFIEGQKVVLAQPETYMNLSGEAVSPLMQFYKLDMDRLLVVYDDIDLPEGRLRMREKGSAGTHNGMRSIIGHTPGQNFPRIRVGIGQPENKEYDLADYVLSKFQNEKVMEEAFLTAADAAKSFIECGIDGTMQKYNKR